MQEIFNHLEILEILKNDDFFIEGRTEHNFNVSEHHKMRVNFRDFLQSNFHWIKEQIKPSWAEIFEKFQNRSFFELKQDLIDPFCETFAFKILGIDDKQIKAVLKLDSLLIFNMKNSEEATVKANEAALRIAEFFREHLSQQNARSSQNLCAEFEKDRAVKSPAHLIQMLIAMLSSVPLMLANQIYLLLSNIRLKTAYVENPTSLCAELIEKSSPTKNLYRVAGPNCPFEKGTILKLNIKEAMKNESDKIPDLGLGYGKHACLGTPILRLLTEFFPKSFFDSFPNAKSLNFTLQIGGNPDIEGVTHLKITH
jgi:hypothetical protein